MESQIQQENILVFIDSDDTVDPYYVENLLNKMINSGSDLVCCGYKDISEQGILDYTDFDFEHSVSLHSFIDMVCKGTGGVLWGKIYKKDIIVKHNLKMDESLFMCEDLVFVLQYVCYCSSFAAVKEYLYNYNRLNQSSISSNVSIGYIQNFITVCKCIEKIFHSVNIDEHKINEVITKEIQDSVINLIEQQSINIKVIGMKKAVYNVKRILSIPYIEKYKDNFHLKVAFISLIYFY